MILEENLSPVFDCSVVATPLDFFGTGHADASTIHDNNASTVQVCLARDKGDLIRRRGEYRHKR